MKFFNQAKKFISNAYECVKNNALVLVGTVTGSIATVLGISQPAQAALPLAATTAFTDLQTDGLALIDLAWPAVIAITIGFIIIKLFKRSANKV
jgi:major coat protein